MRHSAVALAGGLLVAASSGRAASEAPVPLDLQAAIVKKVLSYDHALRAVPRVRFLVVAGGRPGLDAAEVVRVFREAGLAAESCSADRPPELDASTVLYLLPGAGRPELLRAAERAGSLTVSGDPDMLRDGEASIGLHRRRDGRTEIVVNLARARAERHEFSSYLLSMAVVRK